MAGLKSFRKDKATSSFCQEGTEAGKSGHFFPRGKVQK